jgi:GTPase SAR1 family protein
MYYVFFTGTAGSGKTTLVRAFSDFLASAGMEVAIINLDPAVDSVPYKPDFDVREVVDAKELASKYGLGPNSALIAATDLLLTRARELKEAIDEIKADFVLVDTPGQIELIAYRDSGRHLIKLLSQPHKVANVFLMDSFLCTDPRSYVSLILLSSSVKFRLNVPQVNVISKSDLLNRDQEEAIKSWSEGEEIIDALTGIDEFSYELINTLSHYSWGEPVYVSAKAERGLDSLYSALERMYAEDQWEGEETE